MHLTLVQNYAITARMAFIVGAETFDRLFLSVEFAAVEGDVLYVYAQSEEVAAELEDKFSLHILVIAAEVLDRDIGIVMFLPKVLH